MCAGFNTYLMTLTLYITGSPVRASPICTVTCVQQYAPYSVTRLVSYSPPLCFQSICADKIPHSVAAAKLFICVYGMYMCVGGICSLLFCWHTLPSLLAWAQSRAVLVQCCLGALGSFKCLRKVLLKHSMLAVPEARTGCADSREQAAIDHANGCSGLHSQTDVLLLWQSSFRLLHAVPLVSMAV